MQNLKYVVGMLALAFAGCSNIQAKQPLTAAATTPYNVLVGTYTSNASQGINHLQYTGSSNSFVARAVLPGVSNPSFVIANRARTIVVAVEETSSATGGKVTSFKYNSSTQTFTKINSVFTNGDSPCALSFSPNEDYVLAANYTGGNLAVLPISSTGTLSNSVQTVQHSGKSVNVSRQEKPHVHDVVFHPTESKAFIADLGNDTIQMIPLVSGGSPVLQVANQVTVKVAAGAGPRHLIFNRAGTRLYVICELTNQILQYNYANNALTLAGTYNLASTTANGSAAELRLSADEKFMYASIRGTTNQLVVLSVASSGALTKIQSIATGKTPRGFALTPDGANIVVANQDANTVTAFVRNTTTGLLTATAASIAVNKPTYIYFF